MPLPVNLSTGVVTGTLTRLDGLADSGSVSFQPAASRLLDAASDVIITTGALSVTLDAGGSFTITLPATDDPDVSPTGWTYTVTVNTTGGSFSFSMAVPSGSTTNIADVSPTAGSSGFLAAVGIPALGTIGQVLKKASATNYDAAWADAPEKWGPASTGTATTDTANLKAFVAASSAGDHLILPDPGYVVTEIIYIPEDRFYSGNGAKMSASGNTLIKMAPGANLDAVVASDRWASAATGGSLLSANPIIVDHICFDGNRTNQTSGAGHGLVLMNARTSVIECKFAHTRGHGLLLSTLTAAGNEISNSCNEPMILLNNFIDNGGDCLRVVEGNTARFTDGMAVLNIVAGSDNSGINIDRGSGWLVAYNHTYGTPMNGIKIGHGFNTKVIGNYCEGWGYHATPGSYFGINMSTSGLDSSGATEIIGNQVWANASAGPATGTTWTGIGITAANGQDAYATVVANTLNGRTFTTPTRGFLLSCNDSAGKLHVSGMETNTVWGWDTNKAGGTTGLIYVGAVGNTVVNETFSATPVIMPHKAALNGMWRMILTANVTSSTIRDGIDGQAITVQIEQDGTGSRTFAWPGNVVGAPVIASAAGAVTQVTMRFFAGATGGTAKWYV